MKKHTAYQDRCEVYLDGKKLKSSEEGPFIELKGVGVDFSSYAPKVSQAGYLREWGVPFDPEGKTCRVCSVPATSMCCVGYREGHILCGKYLCDYCSCDSHSVPGLYQKC